MNTEVDTRKCEAIHSGYLAYFRLARPFKVFSQVIIHSSVHSLLARSASNCNTAGIRKGNYVFCTAAIKT